MSELDRLQSEFVIQFEDWLKSYFKRVRKSEGVSDLLLDSQQYSLLSGGKRFRPFLAFLIYKLFSDDFPQIQNFCLSLEMIHTYSLIHDDLPSMDNDDFRRGVPTNHKVFTEDISLLAGDGLLTDAFFMISGDELLTVEARVALCKLISQKVGSAGMVSGQALDMKVDRALNFSELKKIHEFKTANLIQCAAVGAAIIAGCNESELHNISEFSYNLGMAFQIKDDLLDRNDADQDFKSYVRVLGSEKTEAELLQHSDSAKKALGLLNRPNSGVVEDLIRFNLKRNS